jgi:hypothetical protein
MRGDKERGDKAICETELAIRKIPNSKLQIPKLLKLET